MSPSPLVASQKVLDLLKRLHAASLSQERSYSFRFWRLTRKLRALLLKTSWMTQDDDFTRDKFVALEVVKSEFLYLIARSTGATTIVEAGTSFGVSTIYLALAAGQNAASQSASPITPGQGGKVIATEKEPEKAKRAREHWKEAGDEVEPWITLLEGDLKETLTMEVDKVDKIDLLLLDIWAPLALPVLKIVQPKLRHGALIIADNTTGFRPAYKDFLDYSHDPKNGFKSMTIPFHGGLEVMVYLPTA
ncbi:hypothetical protein PAAG_04254 [Paracoccidioides lutzii Pb01]|uniref:O-methyltransferase n=1 Tax=Paracoccidioides lutzii (strain ATCC MYA-826 / Pb01) TaxID=502779 RepID=C1H0G0_PARBA|nr:hypothetical protein PAAG_04254 [Paracoccidioides lutzii Pb01]EEH33201.1 hypothetical protein PAAG_04254 [Paracoccidioides lutzii Pb01]